MEFTSKSIIVKKFGGYDSLQITKHQLPSLKDRIEVKVHYCGLNFADLYTRLGLMPNNFPFVLGIECSGIISNIGFETTDYKIGDKVICYNFNGGMYSDLIRVPPTECFKIPNDISLEVAASIFVNYLTAYFAIVTIGNLQKNENVFIPSCAGGVGWAATQLARNIPNVKIFGTASPGKENLLKENGVHHILSYDNLDSELQTFCPEGFDLILETQAGKFGETIQNRLKPLGRIVLLGANSMVTNEHSISPPSISTEIPTLSLVMNNRTVAGFHLGLLAEKEPQKIKNALNHVFCLIRESVIKPRIDSVWKFEEVVDATKVLAERKNIGKVLLKL